MTTVLTEPKQELSLQSYQEMNAQSLPAYLSSLSKITQIIGATPSSWKIKEIGDGNVNLVFIVKGDNGSVIVKQAVPYLRVVGQSWPLSLKRSYFEYRALFEKAKFAQEHLPKVYHYDERLSLIVMELLEPHITMRKGLIKGVYYPSFARHIASFLSKTLFFSSDLALPAHEKKALVKDFCDNTDLCKITEDLIFTNPYIVSKDNRWTSPQLNEIALFFQTNSKAKLAISELKQKFLCSTEALIHGDLHTGSIMITESDTRVIDPEFAFYGPMGFDVGAIVGNLLLAYFSQSGHATHEDPREEYSRWILNQIEDIWNLFSEEFLRLWNDCHSGDLYPEAFFSNNDQDKIAAQKSYMDRLFIDTIGFAAAKMIRRILGLAHVEDLESIENPDLRALCEQKTLLLANEMLINRPLFTTIGDLTLLAAKINNLPKEQICGTHSL